MLNSNFRKVILPNGLTVLTEEISHVRSVAMGVWITVGSRDETVENSGISHFIEHILFKGTKNRNAKQIAASLENVGGNLDAFTTKELTCYNAHCLDEHLPIAVDVIADLIQNSIFDESEIEKEKDVILNEINHYKDTPDDIIFDYFYENVFQNHPLGFQIYGTKKNVKNFSRDITLDFFNNEYGANRIIISASGNLKHDQFLDLINDHFSNLKSSNKRIVKNISSEITSKKEQILNKCSQAHICLGAQAFPYYDEHRFPFLILQTILGGGMSSLLFQKIREEYGLVYAIYTFHDFFIDCGIWGIYFATDEKNISQTIDLINIEVDNLKNGYITEDILAQTKEQLKGWLTLGLESTIVRMSRIAKNEIYLNKYYSINDIIDKVNKVSVQDVLEITHKIFNKDDYFLSILKPE